MATRAPNNYFQEFFGVGLGDIAVNVFFLVSGFLVVQSWNNRRNLIEFCWARFKRIYPAVWVSTVIFVIVFGVLFSPLEFFEFVSLESTLTYVLKNFLLLPGSGAQLTLPFAMNETISEFNTPLWTLPHELQMYGMVVILGVIGLLNKRLVTVFLAVFAMLVWAAGDLGWLSVDASRFRLMSHFMIGIIALRFSRSIVVSGRGAILSIVVCIAISSFVPIEFRKFVLSIAMIPPLLWFSFVPGGPIRKFNSLGDYSYGTYILAYPVQIYLSQIDVISKTASIHFLTTMCLVLPMAICSWHFVERPALTLRLPSVLDRLRTNSHVLKLSARSG